MQRTPLAYLERNCRAIRTFLHESYKIGTLGQGDRPIFRMIGVGFFSLQANSLIFEMSQRNWLVCYRQKIKYYGVFI